MILILNKNDLSPLNEKKKFDDVTTDHFLLSEAVILADQIYYRDGLQMKLIKNRQGSLDGKFELSIVRLYESK